MKVDVTVPELAESISEAVVGEWLKKPGESVQEGDQLVDIETDKVILEVTAPQSGQIIVINKHKSEQVKSNEVIAVIDTNKSGLMSEPAPVKKSTNIDQNILNTTKPSFSQTPVPNPAKSSPAVRKLAAEENIDIRAMQGSGRKGRITKQDIKNKANAMLPTAISEADIETEISSALQTTIADARKDKRVPMTSLRKSIAKRLVDAQKQSATLTTFNEVNLQNIIDLRQRYRESFEVVHGIKLGFMSFFIKAAVEALKEFPVLNASVEFDDIIYHNYFDVGIAVSTNRGLIVPVIRDANRLSFAGIEKAINDFVLRARENKVTIEELTGGTFTITNGGVFGSMMSTPIINPPQSAILGMHTIQARPIASDGEIIVAPMMYLALSYDHRIIDGKEAVQFLVHIKNIVEDPNRLLLQV